MKKLKPKVTCLVTSHMKPHFLREAIDSVLAQTRLRDVDIIVLDSGAWLENRDQDMQDIYVQYHDLPHIEWIFTGEHNNLYKEVTMFAWAFNTAEEMGLLRGEYFFMLNDDDVIDPTYIERMAGYLDEHPDHDMVYCGERRVVIHHDGRREQTGIIPAISVREGETWDCAIDYLQVMWRLSLLKKIEKPYYNEDKAYANHMDGLFLNKLGKVAKGYNITDVLCENRRTKLSTTDPARD